jgi:hypothetical protein
MKDLSDRVDVVEGDIETLNGDVNTAGSVAKAIADAIAALNLADTYAAKVHGHEIADVNGLADALAGLQGKGDYAAEEHKHEIADVNGLADAIADAKKAGTDANAALETYKGTNDVAVKANTDAIAAMKDHESVDSFADVMAEIAKKQDIIPAETYDAYGSAAQALADAKDYADGLDEVMDGRVAALEAKFGDGEGNVDAQIAAAVAAEAKLREDADKALQDQIGEASAEGKAASGLHARIEELEDLVGDDKVSEAIAAAVKVEADRAKGVEGGLETRLKAVEDDHLVAADKTELEGKITANANAIELLTNGVSAEEVDGVNDLIQYVKEHGTEVTGMKADIKANADAIAAIPQADWNQNDPEAADYIKNRPFYEVSGNGIVLFDETIAAEDLSYSSDFNSYSTSYKYNLVEGVETSYEQGNTYTVIYDGVTYTDVPCGNDYYNFIGDKNLVNYPFCSYIGGTDGNGGSINFNSTTPGPHTIKIIDGEPGTLVQLDEKFIPDTIARVADVNADIAAANAAIEALETKVDTGDQKVSEYVAAAIEDAKTDASNKDAVVLAEAQKAAAAVQSALDTHTGNGDIHVTAEQKTTWDSAVQTVTAAADSGLKATKTGTDVAIAIDDSIVWVFDCGTSAV